MKKKVDLKALGTELGQLSGEITQALTKLSPKIERMNEILTMLIVEKEIVPIGLRDFGLTDSDRLLKVQLDPIKNLQALTIGVTGFGRFGFWLSNAVSHRNEKDFKKRLEPMVPPERKADLA